MGREWGRERVQTLKQEPSGGVDLVQGSDCTTVYSWIPIKVQGELPGGAPTMRGVRKPCHRQDRVHAQAGVCACAR